MPTAALYDEQLAFFAQDPSAGIRGVRPFREPEQAQVRTQAVQVGNAGQEAERVLADVAAEGAPVELHDRRGQRGPAGGAAAIPGEGNEGAVEHGEGGGR